MEGMVPLDIKLYLNKLYDNRLLENETEIQIFEECLSKILYYGDVSVIPRLCLAFDDETEQYEIMFGLIHSIENLYKNNMEKGLTLIAKSIPKIMNRGKEWAEILHYRILNHSRVRLTYGEILSQLDSPTRNVVIGLLIEIKNEDPDMFKESVDEIMSLI